MNVKRYKLNSKGIIICIFVLIIICKVESNDKLKDKIDGYVENFIKSYKVPGVSISIINDNKVIYSNSWGITGEENVRVTSKTPFTIGSISKSLTGLGILRLIEKDEINLYDPVQKHIPWFTLRDKESSSKITILHLLTHTSGISNYAGLQLSDLEYDGFNGIKECVKRLSKSSLKSNPGETYQYSNANFLILGALIEEKTNQTFSQYMEQQVFNPLKMIKSAADRDSAYKKGYYAGYQSWLGFPVKSSIKYDNSGSSYGYITSNSEDMVQFLKLLSKKDHKDFLSEISMALYLHPYVKTGNNSYYGLGIRISNPGKEDEMIWHSGSTPESHSELFYMPYKDIGVIILTNKNHFFEVKGLINLKQGIINILNDKDPIKISPYFPFIQVIIIIIMVLLIVSFIYFIIKNKIKKRILWRVIGSFILMISIVTVPFIMIGIRIPWNTIRAFSPDISILIIILMAILALNGLLLIFLSFIKKNQNNSYDLIVDHEIDI